MTTSYNLKKIREGDKKAFHEVFEVMYPSLVFFAQRYIDDIHIAEDVVQESFIALWKQRETINEKHNLKSLLYTSVKNRCLNALRDKKLRLSHYEHFSGELVETDDYYENILIEEEVWSLLLKTLECVGEQTKKVCLMSIDGFKNSEIADQLNISIRSVKYHKSLARSVLSISLKNSVYLAALFIN